MSTSGSGFGQPDLDALTRLANQYFQEWPGKQDLAANPLPSSPQVPDWESSVPLGRPAAFPFSMPGEAELKAVLESLWPAVTDAPANTEAQGWGAAPQGWSGAPQG